MHSFTHNLVGINLTADSHLHVNLWLQDSIKIMHKFRKLNVRSSAQHAVHAGLMMIKKNSIMRINLMQTSLWLFLATRALIIC
jgi:hypothetical protein